MDKDSIKQTLAERADELGFDSLRVARPDKVGEFESEFFLEWLRLGKCDQMEYLKRNVEKRLNPLALFEEVKSVIVLSAGFFRPSDERRVALFAQGADYHRVLKAKLLKLDEILKSFGGKQKLCVDTSPIMEKYYAVKSGIGWRGKNSLVITQKNGPWQFLSLILTSLELEPDAPAAERCGTCSKCIEACPSGALCKPYSVDARLCISNLTIERKTPLSDSEREIAKGKIFGCDECLRACPFGKGAPLAKMPEFRGKLEIPDGLPEGEIKNFIDSKRAQNSGRRPK